MQPINLIMAERLSYESEGCVFILSLENGKVPDGTELSGAWVLRNADAEFIDSDKNRHDLAEGRNMSLWPTKSITKENYEPRCIS